jgi:hypothetical protein
MAFVQLFNLTAQNHRIKRLNLSAKQVTCRPRGVLRGAALRAREAGDSVKFTKAVARFTGSTCSWIINLGLAPQALCCRPLRGLRDSLCKATVDRFAG